MKIEKGKSPEPDNGSLFGSKAVERIETKTKVKSKKKDVVIRGDSSMTIRENCTTEILETLTEEDILKITEYSISTTRLDIRKYIRALVNLNYYDMLPLSFNNISKVKTLVLNEIKHRLKTNYYDNRNTR